MESKDKRKEYKQTYNLIYRYTHAEEISAKKKERMICDCGMEICKRHLKTHLNNSLHKKELEKRKELLEEKTNPDITKLILSFL